MSRDWAQLNSELLHLIFQKLENFSNSIRFRSVCKEWRSVFGPDPEHFSHLPWILYPMKGCDMTDYCIYSLSSNTTRQIKLPTNHIGLKIFNNVGSTNGFFLLQHSISNIPYLFNPITGTEIYPPFNKDNSFTNIFYMDLLPNSTSRKKKSGVHFVFCERLSDAILESKLQVGLWKPNNNEFTSFIIPISSRTVAYYKGKLFVYSCPKLKTWIFDMNTGAEIGTAIPNAIVGQCIRYLLMVAMGDLLMVAMKMVEGRIPYIFQFNVYRLEHTYNFDQCRWIELKGIGDRIMFVRVFNTSMNAFCLSTSKVNGLKGNCIYYFSNYHDNVLRYNMEEGTTDRICHIATQGATWFMPSYN